MPPRIFSPSETWPRAAGAHVPPVHAALPRPAPAPGQTQSESPAWTRAILCTYHPRCARKANSRRFILCPLRTWTLSGGAPTRALRKGRLSKDPLCSEDTACTFPFILGETQNKKGREKAEKCRKVCGVAPLASHVPEAQEGTLASEASPSLGGWCEPSLLQCPARRFFCSLPNAKLSTHILQAHSRRTEKCLWIHTSKNHLAPIQDGHLKGLTSCREAPLHFKFGQAACWPKKTTPQGFESRQGRVF